MNALWERLPALDELGPVEEFSMHDDRQEDTRARRRRHRRRRTRTDADAWDEDRKVGDEERRYRQARQRADAKVKLVNNSLRYLLLGLLLLIVVPPVGVIILIIVAVKFGRRFFEMALEPKLRQKLIDREVKAHVSRSVGQKRRELESEHARSVEALSASIAHEIRNPLTAAKSLVQQMGEDPSARDNVQYARVALEELQRVERSISHLLRFARDEELRFAELRMSEVLDSALESFGDRFSRAGVDLVRNFDCEGVMEGDSEKLRRVAINLMGNALDALEQSGTPDPELRVEMGENLAGSEVWVRIRDNGPGIDASVQQKIFSPFYTSKANGTGLGLAITRKLVDAHRGSVELSSSAGAGTEFVLSFPKQRPEQGVSP